MVLLIEGIFLLDLTVQNHILQTKLNRPGGSASENRIWLDELYRTTVIEFAGMNSMG